MDEKHCNGCGLHKSLSEFNWRNRNRGTVQARCRSCTREQVRSHYNRHRGWYIERSRARNDAVSRQLQARVLAFLINHPCVDCGEADPVCLEFDHVRGDKLGDIGRMLGDHRPWRVIEAEIAKCDVRCANCHRRRTARVKGWYRLQSEG